MPIYSSWYRNQNSNIIKLILNELGVKTNYTYVLKLPFAAAEIIRKLDQGEGAFFSKPDQFYSEYTLKITQIDQHLHSYKSIIIYIDGLRQFGRVFLTKFTGSQRRIISINVLPSKIK